MIPIVSTSNQCYSIVYFVVLTINAIRLDFPETTDKENYVACCNDAEPNDNNYSEDNYDTFAYEEDNYYDHESQHDKKGAICS